MERSDLLEDMACESLLSVMVQVSNEREIGKRFEDERRGKFSMRYRQREEL